MLSVNEVGVGEGISSGQDWPQSDAGVLNVLFPLSEMGSALLLLL